MKAFALFAFAALCSSTIAIAASMISTVAYVWGKSVSNSAPHCIYIGDVCPGEGASICVVSVPVQGITMTPSQVFRDSPNCSILLTGAYTFPLSGFPEEQITQLIIKEQ